ncbi:FAD-dependent oxidoreductase [Pseudomonas mandelii]|uniref:FAD-dependent oxidoreductase n=1 Tax=Pseudomonas mandelii TaxID=75612 RepID=UPI003C73310C
MNAILSSLNPLAKPEELDIAYAAHYLSESTTLPITQITHKWTGLRSFAPDKRQVVGFSPQDENFFWLAGQGGSGILTSPALSVWAADLFLEGAPPDELCKAGLQFDVFSSARLSRGVSRRGGPAPRMQTSGTRSKPME